MRRLVPTPTFMRVPRAPLVVPGRRAQYSGTGAESLVRRATSGRGGGRLRRPGAVTGPGVFARRDPLVRIAPLRTGEGRA